MNARLVSRGADPAVAHLSEGAEGMTALPADPVLVELTKVIEAGLVPRKYCPHTPTGKQALLLLAREREVFFGGAGGGGKSDVLLMAALQYCHLPKTNSIIFRRTFRDLSQPEAIMARSHEWLQGSDAHWSGALNRWTFPNGSTLTFAVLADENAKYQYQSAAYQTICFDELTQFTESQYSYLFSRQRRLAGSRAPLRILSAANPGGVGHDWVKRRFIENQNHPDRRFIPAKLQDNPYIDREQYMASLKRSEDWLLIRQIMNGDWTARREGAMFKREWFNVVDSVPVEVSGAARYWDFAATEEDPKKQNDPDFTAGVRGVYAQNQRFIITNVRRARLTPEKTERLVKQAASEDGIATHIWIEQEPGASGKQVISRYVRLLGGYTVRGDPATGEQVLRPEPLAAYAEAGNVDILKGPWNREFLDELEQYPLKGSHDDQVVAAAGCFNKLTMGSGFIDYIKGVLSRQMQAGADRYVATADWHTGGGAISAKPRQSNGAVKPSDGRCTCGSVGTHHTAACAISVEVLRRLHGD